MKSPSEFYIKFLITSGLDDEKIYKKLEGYKLSYIPCDEYLPELRENLKIPRNFSPLNKSHKPSMDFLEKEGIYELWHPYPSTLTALSYVENSALRELLMAALSTPLTIPEICELMHKSNQVGDIKAIMEFKHYFWNLDLLSYQDRWIIAEHPLTSKIVKAGLESIRDPIGSYILLWKLGFIPNSPSVKMMYTRLRDIAFYNALDADRTLQQSSKKSTALKNYSEIVVTMQSKLEGISESEDLVLPDKIKSNVIEIKDFNEN